jgi:hypothetical protein
MGQRITVLREEAETPDGSVEPGRIVTLSGTVTSLTTARGIDLVEIEEAGPGDIVAVAGLPEITIGDTITDPAEPRPLARLSVDEPTLRMTFGVNTSPMAGREGRLLTSRQIKARLATSASRFTRPARRTPSRCEAAASCSWRCSSSRCVAKATSCRSHGRRSCSMRWMARSRSRTNASASTSRRSTSALSRPRWQRVGPVSSR